MAFAFDHLVSKQMAPAVDWRDVDRVGHFVQFYRDDDFIVSIISKYLIHGIRLGDKCVVVATPKHIKKIENTLSRSLRGLFQTVQEDGLFIAFDAEDVLAEFMVGDTPDAVLFEKKVAPILETTPDARTRIFGEMVAILVARGNPAAAVELERLWNQMRLKCAFSLFCAYPIEDLANSNAGDHFSDICCNHSSVLPDESYSTLTSADERLRCIAALQHRNLELESTLTDLKRKSA